MLSFLNYRIISLRFTHTHIHSHTFSLLQLWYGELSIDSTCWADWCLRGRGWDVCDCVCVSEGNSPLDRVRQPGATAGFQSSRRQGGPGLTGHSKPSLFNSPCPGANKLTPWSGAPHACPPPCLATGRAVCLMGEPTAWPSPTRLLGTVLACEVCVCEAKSRQQSLDLSFIWGGWISISGIMNW